VSAGILSLVAVFVGLSILRTPIAMSMLAGSMVYLWVSRQDIGLVVDQTMNTLGSLYILLAVPMFILAANVMNVTTISDRLWGAADALVGRYKGGLGHVTVLVNIVFSGISGSAVTDAAGPGMLAMRMMRSSRYPAGFSAALIAAASTIAPIIPPSIPMVLYAVLSGASVGALFMAGFLPGMLMGGALMLAIFIVAQTRGLPSGAPVPLRQVGTVLGRALIPLTLPIVLLGGLFSGVFTPTEAAAVAAIYAMLLGAIVYRNLGSATLAAVLLESARQSAVVMILIASAFVVNYAVAVENVAQQLASTIVAWKLTPFQFLLSVNLIFLVLGCFLDASVLLLVFVPVLLPAARELGIDLVYFGVVIILNLMIGLITPPYGLLLLVLSGLGKVPLVQIVREIWIFVLPLVAVLLMLILFPGLVLWLPRATGMLPS
jgi:tripartite ATP-independent transporter DctM subunit